jgi:hypothetical protein
MKFNLDSIGAILISALLAGEQDAILAFLQTFYTKDPDEYKAIVALANYGLKKAAEAATKSATTLDDQTIAAAHSILAASAAKNGIAL